MKKWFYVIILLIIVCFVSGFFLWKMMISPQYSLKQLDKAISEKNITVFEKYVDLEQLIDSIVIQTWEYYTLEKKTETYWDEIRYAIGNSILSLITPNLKEIIKREVIEYIAIGQWNELEKEPNEGFSSFIITIIRERIDPGNWDYQSINYLRSREDYAFVGLTYYDQSRGTNFIVEVKMRNMKGYWQIIEITNIAQLINLLKF